MHQTWSSWWRIGIAAIALAAGCGDDGTSETLSPPPPPIAPEVVVATSPASTADCPYGGTIVRSGLDDNHNQQLDDSEVKTRTAVCNDAPAAPPPKVVFRLVAEPPGLGCDDKGGTAVQSGPDRNGNGVLDDDEVEHTDLLCDDRLITRFRPEPEGANCVAGGIAFQVGHDRDHSGELDDGEVERTDFTCGDILTRSIEIESDADVAALAGIRVIDGSVLVSHGSLTEFALPAVQHIRDIVLFGSNAGLTRISLPKLGDIGRFLFITDDPALAIIELPLLSRIGGNFELRAAGGLADTGMPQLGNVGGTLTIRDNPVLASAKIGAGVDGEIDVENNPQLAALKIVSTDRLDKITIENNGLQEVEIFSEALLAHPTVMAGATIANNPALTSVEIFSDGEVGTLSLFGNPVLHQISLTFARAAGDIAVSNNPKLDALLVDNFRLSAPAIIAGSLRIEDPLRVLFALSSIEIGGSLRVRGSQLTTLFPVTHVGDDLQLENNPVLDDGLPLAIGGDLIVTGNAALFNLFFVTNTAYLGHVIIADNAKLVNLQGLGSATSVAGSLSITGNPKLLVTGTHRIVQVGGQVTIAGNAALTELGLDALERSDSLAINANAALPEISLPALRQAGGVQLLGNPVAKHIEMPELESASAMVVDDNPQLPSCEVLAVFAQLSASAFVEQHGNDDTTTCGPDDGDSAQSAR